MVGREVELTVDRGESTPGAQVLEVKDLHVKDDRGHETVRGVTINVRADLIDLANRRVLLQPVAAVEPGEALLHDQRLAVVVDRALRERRVPPPKWRCRCAAN